MCVPHRYDGPSSPSRRAKSSSAVAVRRSSSRPVRCSAQVAISRRRRSAIRAWSAASGRAEARADSRAVRCSSSERDGPAAPAGTARQRDDLARQVPPALAGPSGASFSASWFRARAVLALHALAGEVSPGVAREFFALTSVRVFRELPEARRAHRIDHVERAMTELALT
jgi:hypothetical protein